jgi:glycosyltransferase involved in cell wall biosynthesis
MSATLASPPILLVSSRGDFGGGTEHMYRLCEGLIRREHRVFAALPKEEPYWNLFTRLIGEDSCFEIPHRKFTLEALVRLNRFASAHDIKLVHSHGKGAATFGRPLSMLSFGRIQGVHTAHGIHTGRYNQTALALYRLYENVTARLGTHHIIYVSDSERDKAQATGLWLETDSSVIFNGVLPGIDLRHLDSQQQLSFVSDRRNELGLPQDRFLVVTISRFDHQKNMLLAYQIAQRLPNMTFVWVGDGTDREPLQRRAAAEGVNNIVFVGFQRNTQRYLAVCDAYLSTSRWEGLPLAVLEAMANGVPIVASDVVGNRDILKLSNKFLGFPLDYPQQALEHLQMLSDDVEFRRRAAAACIEQHHRHFDLESMIDRTVSVYAKVLNGR